ncbi:MAG: type II secretion system F family protein [Candidatus Peregrinibacteria bacterium]|nr:type II secretion system F family protein [Candidatus Peregrinibacteria bacterium]
MTAYVGKIKDAFSDFWLNIELMFSRKPKKSEQPQPASPAPQSNAQPGVMPVNPVNGSANGEMLISMQSKKADEKKERVKNAKLPFALRHLNLSTKARLYFYDQMATLVGSGVPLIDALSLIQAQEKNKTVKLLYAEMIHDINAGLSLAEAMEKFPHVFPRMQSALVEAAEASGNIKEVLAELVEEMEASQDFLKKVTGAMVYPIVLVFLALILVGGMMTFVIPKIAAMYEQANVKLPALTQTVINISDFIVNKWPILIASIIGGALFLYIFFARLTFGRLLWEKFISILPVVGRINREKNIMIIASNMGMLMRSGVLITEAFAITKNTVGNLHYQKALEEIRQGVVMGKEVSQLMGLVDIRAQKFKEHKLFPLQMAQLIHIGETTGNIAAMLFKIKKNYHKSIDYTLRNISTLVEPLMIFLVAALVGSILMAVMLPFFYIGSTVS